MSDVCGVSDQGYMSGPVRGSALWVHFGWRASVAGAQRLVSRHEEPWEFCLISAGKHRRN